jgi:ribosomal protein L11
MSQLADDLQRLAAKLDEQSRTPKQQAELEQVQKAAVAARQGDKTSVWEHLTQAGKWVLGIARDVGVEVAAAVISAAIGA